MLSNKSFSIFPQEYNGDPNYETNKIICHRARALQDFAYALVKAEMVNMIFLPKTLTQYKYSEHLISGWFRLSDGPLKLKPDELLISGLFVRSLHGPRLDRFIINKILFTNIKYQMVQSSGPFDHRTNIPDIRSWLETGNKMADQSGYWMVLG
jgi:hypothetical protein